VLAALALGCGSSTAMPASAPSHLLGKPLPAFKRNTLKGDALLDTGAFKGRPVVVKFFAEYCQPCKRTLPLAERLHKDNPDVAFVGVSEDDYASTAEQVGRSYGLSFPIVHDQGKALKGRFRVDDLPVTFVADRQGVVRWVGGPAQTEQDFEQAIEAVER
jgi:thiol-disulfide isomerase/thioredoxin